VIERSFLVTGNARDGGTLRIGAANGRSSVDVTIRGIDSEPAVMIASELLKQALLVERGGDGVRLEHCRVTDRRLDRLVSAQPVHEDHQGQAAGLHRITADNRYRAAALRAVGAVERMLDHLGPAFDAGP
jgi:hypothetical protein